MQVQVYKTGPMQDSEQVCFSTIPGRLDGERKENAIFQLASNITEFNFNAKIFYCIERLNK